MPVVRRGSMSTIGVFPKCGLVANHPIKQPRNWPFA